MTNRHSAIETPLTPRAREHRAHAIAATNLATCAEFNAGDFLAIASHDLLAPLMSMTSVAARIVERSSAESGDPQIRAWAEDILAYAAGMERFVRDLEFGALDEGRLRLTTGRHDVAVLVNHATDAYQRIATNRSIGLSREVSGPLVVSCDSFRILQVLSNLIDNAVKFTPLGGSIRVRATRQQRDCQIAVVDTGIGIAKSRLTSIFAPTQQRTFHQRGRRGLGLFISRTIVDAHKGRIWAEAQRGVGTTVFFRLPLA